MFETIMLSVAFIVVVSFCAAFAFWLRGWRKVFPIVIGVIVLALGIWYFGWLYGLWAFLAIVALGALFWAMIRPSWRVLHYIFGLIWFLIVVVGIALVFLSVMTPITPLVTNTEPVITSCATVVPVPPAVCDPSTVPFTDMGELNPYVTTTITGPAIYEWWTGGSNEGVQRVDAGHSVTIHGAKGHYWTLPSQLGLDCAWSLHVSNYAAKPQHAGKTYDQLVVPPPADLLK